MDDTAVLDLTAATVKHQYKEKQHDKNAMAKLTMALAFDGMIDDRHNM